VHGDLDGLGDVLHEGWMLKQQIAPTVSSPYIDRLYALARAAGARGGKVTGAGGGGFLMLYCRPERQGEVRERLEGEGARAMHFRFDLRGATVVYNDPFFDAGGRGGTRWEFVPIAAAGS
jgi:D-glycero-alpha-D-manno-heptose-7-phosphate kinase